MARRSLRLVAFLIGVAGLVAALKVAHWIPAAAQRDLLRRYGTVEEVRAAMSPAEVYVPSYIPQELGWPPSAIVAQRRPFPAVVMEFENAGRRETALVISQAPPGRELPGVKIPLARVDESVRYSLKGRDAVLWVGASPRGEQISRLAWTESAVRIDLVAKTAPVELIKVAESMLR